MTNIVLQAANTRDADGLTACIRAAYRRYAGRITDLPDVAAGIAEDIRDRVVWLAVDGDQVLGGLVIRIEGDVAHVANLAVHPDAGGAGLGRRLMDKAEELAAGAGCTKLRLATHVDLTEVQEFYARLGWIEMRREGNKVMMGKSI